MHCNDYQLKTSDNGHNEIGFGASRVHLDCVGGGDLAQVGVVQSEHPQMWRGYLKGRALKVVHIQNEWR